MEKLNFDYDSQENCYVASFGDYTIKAISESNPSNPRTEWDNSGVLVCEHSRYDLGDEDSHSKAAQAIRESRFYRETWEDSESGEFTYRGESYGCLDFSNVAVLFEAMQWCDDIELTPLYLYDHSGISISAGPFACPWDSGQVGFAFIAAKQRDAMGWNRWTPRVRALVRAALLGEIEIYDDYLTGQVYGFEIEDSNGDSLDSCWGYYGDDFSESGLEESALASLEYIIEEARKGIEAARKIRDTRLKTLIRNRVPLEIRADILESA